MLQRQSRHLAPLYKFPHRVASPLRVNPGPLAGILAFLAAALARPAPSCAMHCPGCRARSQPPPLHPLLRYPPLLCLLYWLLLPWQTLAIHQIPVFDRLCNKPSASLGPSHLHRLLFLTTSYRSLLLLKRFPSSEGEEDHPALQQQRRRRQQQQLLLLHLLRLQNLPRKTYPLSEAPLPLLQLLPQHPKPLVATWLARCRVT